MTSGDPIVIPRTIGSFRPPIMAGTEGVYRKPKNNGLGQALHEVEIDGKIFPLKETEFESATVEPAREYDNL